MPFCMHFRSCWLKQIIVAVVNKSVHAERATWGLSSAHTYPLLTIARKWILMKPVYRNIFLLSFNQRWKMIDTSYVLKSLIVDIAILAKRQTVPPEEFRETVAGVWVDLLRIALGSLQYVSYSLEILMLKLYRKSHNGFFCIHSMSKDVLFYTKQKLWIG